MGDCPSSVDAVSEASPLSLTASFRAFLAARVDFLVSWALTLLLKSFGRPCNSLHFALRYSLRLPLVSPF